MATKGEQDATKCDCWKRERQVCDICQGVTGNEVDAGEPVASQPSELARTFEEWWPKFLVGKHPDVDSMVYRSVGSEAWNASQGSQPVIEPLAPQNRFQQALNGELGFTAYELAKELQQHRKAQQERIGGRG